MCEDWLGLWGQGRWVFQAGAQPETKRRLRVGWGWVSLSQRNGGPAADIWRPPPWFSLASRNRDTSQVASSEAGRSRKAPWAVFGAPGRWGQRAIRSSWTSTGQSCAQAHLWVALDESHLSPLVCSPSFLMLEVAPTSACHHLDQAPRALWPHSWVLWGESLMGPAWSNQVWLSGGVPALTGLWCRAGLGGGGMAGSCLSIARALRAGEGSTPVGRPRGGGPGQVESAVF